MHDVFRSVKRGPRRARLLGQRPGTEGSHRTPAAAWWPYAAGTDTRWKTGVSGAALWPAGRSGALEFENSSATGVDRDATLRVLKLPSWGATHSTDKWAIQGAKSARAVVVRRQMQ